MEQTEDYLIFHLAEQTYGVPAEKVTKILAPRPIWSMPGTPNYVLGLIKIDDRAVPVGDLRIKFNLPVTEMTEESRILIMNIRGWAGVAPVGVVADRVLETRTLSQDVIHPPADKKLGQDKYLGVLDQTEPPTYLLNLDLILGGNGLGGPLTDNR